MVSWLDILEIIPESARRGPVILLLLLRGSSTKDILIIFDRYLYILILKASMDGGATKLCWYTDPAFNSPFS